MHYKNARAAALSFLFAQGAAFKTKKASVGGNIKDDKRAGPKTRFFRPYFV